MKNILKVHFYLDLVIFNSIFYNSHSLLSKTPKCNASVTPIGKQIRSNTVSRFFDFCRKSLRSAIPTRTSAVVAALAC